MTKRKNVFLMTDLGLSDWWFRSRRVRRKDSVAVSGSLCKNDKARLRDLSSFWFDPALHRMRMYYPVMKEINGILMCRD